MRQQQIFPHRRHLTFAGWAGVFGTLGLVLLLASNACAQPPQSARQDPSADLVQKQAAKRLLADMGPNLPIDGKVARLIDRLALRDRDQVQAAVTALEMLGQPAVPSMIHRIDDRRPMPVGVIEFENRSPDAFEGVRHLGVARVVDALNLILYDLTGEDVGTIVADNGPDGGGDSPNLDPQRQAVVNGWRAYLARQGKMPPVPGKTPPVPGKSLPSADGR
ncbi:MAG: hypothetical protein ACYC61_14635 [Isosphaeraceae bacterium]